MDLSGTAIRGGGSVVDSLGVIRAWVDASRGIVDWSASPDCLPIVYPISLAPFSGSLLKVCPIFCSFSSSVFPAESAGAAIPTPDGVSAALDCSSMQPVDVASAVKAATTLSSPTLGVQAPSSPER